MEIIVRQNNVSIYNGVVLGDDVFIGPSVVFTNDKYPDVKIWDENLILKTLINDGVSIGANSTILPGIEIGKNTLIGLALCFKIFGEKLLVYGNPAKEIKKTKMSKILIIAGTRPEIIKISLSVTLFKYFIHRSTF